MPRLLDGIVLPNALVGLLDEGRAPCQPRILVVADGTLDFSPYNFGLSRFVAAIQDQWAKPIITLAHRNLAAHNVTIDGQFHRVLGRFDFAADPSLIKIDNCDQLWLFGSLASNSPLSTEELKLIATFMNNGGGVFATGDHGRLGEGMGAELPRIRHMRDWSSIPMGTEAGPKAQERINTTTNPGANTIHEFDDQSDYFPQRIYPNYRVTWAQGNWSASVHPLLRLPWTPPQQSSPADLAAGMDIDVLPDHPHESVCFEVSQTANFQALGSSWSRPGLGFKEFPLGRDGFVGAEIVAYAVSAAPSIIYGSIHKPPVKPRMFAVISAYDGHQANAYTGMRTKPGRIVCDSTWHHFINLNIDGGNTGRNGLGYILDGKWTPSPACNRIFRYYQNIVAWLQPNDRQTCQVYGILLVLRFHALLIEELTDAHRFADPGQFEILGRTAMQLIDAELGAGAAGDALRAAVGCSDRAAEIAAAADADPIWCDHSDPSSVVPYLLGRTLAQLAGALPIENIDAIKKQLSGKAHERFEKQVGEWIAAAAGEALTLQIERARGRLDRLVALEARAYPRK
jgi:hypothetical protein